jgi:hypothetical protein
METENRGKEDEPGKGKISQRPHPLGNQIPKGALPDTKACPTRLDRFSPKRSRLREAWGVAGLRRPALPERGLWH